MARRRKNGRDVSGILVLDKPRGYSSNQALQTVRRLFNARKAGHTGNLDPMATGVLPICLGEATKVSAFLLDADKGYHGTIRLGVTTDTGDAEGEVIETRPVPALDEARVEEVLARFRGPIEQLPPMYSAVKQGGQPLYKLAREGREVERKPRPVTIHELQSTRIGEDRIDIEVHCSKGTYIRTLAEEIGEGLGCGGHLSALARTRAGPFDMTRAVTLERLREVAEEGTAALDALLMPAETGLEDWPRVQLSSTGAFYVRQGQPVQVPGAPIEGMVRLFEGESTFIGIGHILDDGRVAPKRLL
ncbi:MAG: tRNA pseudouridine(55) synthase TruB, partial [Pseudomonadota bacterium]